MRISITHSLVAAAVAAASLAAMAQDANPFAAPSNTAASARADRGMHKGLRLTPEQRRQRFDQYTAKQAQELGITAAQRPQWDAWVQSRRDMFRDMPGAQGDRRALHQQMQSMTPDQREQFMASRMGQRAQQMQRMADASKNLRAVLSPEQRAKFDQLGQKRWGHGGPRCGASAPRNTMPMNR